MERSQYRYRLWVMMNVQVARRHCVEMQAVCSPVHGLIAQTKSSDGIRFTEDCCYHIREEYLERYYSLADNREKMRELTSFYKYHQEVPRLFMGGKCVIIHQFYDSQRRINYERVKKMLELESESAVLQSEGIHSC